VKILKEQIRGEDYLIRPLILDIVKENVIGKTYHEIADKILAKLR